MPTRVAQLRIGCSGWNYKSWRGRFYPDSMPPADWLRFYQSIFDTVETNATFYRLPEATTFASWHDQTPPGFVMAIKASRYLTHLKRLIDPEAPLERLFERTRALGTRLGPVLYQLPGRFRADLGRLDRFLDALPGEVPLPDGTAHPLQHAIEFRDPSWYTDEVFGRLDARGVALCLHDMAGSAIDRAGVGPFTYVRFHGAAGKYHGSYPDDALKAWARRLAAEWRSGRDVYAYFNNDPDAVATHDAQRLRDRAIAEADGVDAPETSSTGRGARRLRLP
jgi:uncharacterized protein YecE (DUF72 family)